MKTKSLILLSLLLIQLTACTSNAGNVKTIVSPSPDTNVPGNGTAPSTVAGWEITVEKTTLNKTLNNASTSLGYTGNTNVIEYNATPAPGYQFCLVKMNITKLDSDEEFDWDKLVLRDQNGNEYKRDNDIYLPDLGFNRMPGTNLNFGTNNGWIAFQVKDAANNLTLSYPFKSETFTYNINEKGLIP